MQTHKTTGTDKQTLSGGLTTMPSCPAVRHNRQPGPQHSPYALTENEDVHNASQITELEEASAIGMLAPTMQVASPAADGLEAMRQLLSSDRLNVIGEDHFESKERRDDETFIARNIANGEYWLEDDYIHKTAEGTLIEGDPWSLRAKQCQIDIRDFILINLDKELKAMVTKQKNNNLYGYISEGINLCHGLIQEISYFVETEEIKKLDYERSEDFNINKKLIELATQCKDSLTTFSANKKNTNNKEKIIYLKTVINSVYNLVKFNLTDNEDADSVRTQRSQHMHKYANIFYTDQGIWKIGNDHYNDIKDNPESFNYTLIGRTEFNKAWAAWKSPITASPKAIPTTRFEPNPNPNHIKTRRKKGWCAGFPCCCLGWC